MLNSMFWIDVDQEEDASLSKKRKMVDYAAADCIQIKASNLEVLIVDLFYFSQDFSQEIF